MTLVEGGHNQPTTSTSDAPGRSAVASASALAAKGESEVERRPARSFERDGHRVVLGDATTVLDTEVRDESVDLVFADPPYNIGKRYGDFIDRWPSDEEYLRWCSAWLECCIRKLKPNGALYLMSSTQAMPLLDVFLRQRLTVVSRIVWHYDSSGVQARKFYGSMYEPILFCARDAKNYVFNADDIKVEARTGAVRKLIDYRKAEPTPYNTEKVPGNVWYYPRVRYRMDEYEEHPSQKPEALLDRVIRASTMPGGLVLDPFAGTFTTAAVAQKLGRQSISFDINQDYVRIGLRRLGVETAVDGIALTRPDKTYVRRNGKAVAPAAAPTLPLFDGKL